MIKGFNDEEEPMIKSGPNCWHQFLYNTKIQIILVLVLCLAIGIGTPFLWQYIWKADIDCCKIESDLRYDCYPQQPQLKKNKTLCLLAGCCWDSYDNGKDHQIRCYYGLLVKSKGERMPGYLVEREDELSALLKVDQLPFSLQNTSVWPLGPTQQVHYKLNLSVQHYTPDHFSINIMPLNDISPNLIPFQNPIQNSTTDESHAKIGWKSGTNDRCKDCFSLTVKRKDTNQIIFNTGDFSPFIYSEGYIEITTLLPNDYFYGLGQSPSRGLKHNMTYPDDWQIFNKYHLNITGNETSWFGSHPFYMGWTNDSPKRAYGILLLNSYPIEVITNSRPSLTFRTIGGNLNFHFFLGPKPKDVFKSLYGMIGKPFLPPYWSLGFHMCRTECHLSQARGVIKDMIEEGIPFESDCGSAAHSTNIFPTPLNMVELNEFYKDVNTQQKVRILLVQVPQKPSLEAIKDEEGTVRSQKGTVPENWKQYVERWGKYALKVSETNKDLNYKGYFYDWCGQIPGITNRSVIYPDFTDSSDEGMKKEIMNDLDRLDLKIDGIFLDYNTPLDLSYERTRNMSKTCHEFIEVNKWNKYFYWELNKYTPCLDTVQYKEPFMETLVTHNMYGYNHMKMVCSFWMFFRFEQRMTQEVLDKLDKGSDRKLVMSLSTFIGSGSLGGHIGTNMNATWDMLLQSHIQTLEFNMFGIPLTGFPVCGFKGKAPDQELCLRWYQLAALQPFMISHRDFGEDFTDPISLTKVSGNKVDSMAREAIKSAIVIRYQLLPYIYTQFYKANLNNELPFRPLFYEFPEDEKTYKIDKQYMWGEGLMVMPVTQPNIKTNEEYFPEGVWYDFYSGRRIAVNEGQHINVSTFDHQINLQIRGGYVIPTQPAINNTDVSRREPFTLIAALDLANQASGDLYIDGLSLCPIFTVLSNSFEIATNIPENLKTKDEINTSVDTIKIYGIIDPLFPHSFNISLHDIKTNEISNKEYSSYRYDPSKGVLTFHDISEQCNFAKYDQINITWTFRTWNK